MHEIIILIKLEYSQCSYIYIYNTHACHKWTLRSENTYTCHVTVIVV